MKKISSRALSVLLIAALVMTGVFVFVREDYLHGRRWATTFSGFDPDAEGELQDVNGTVLAAFGKNYHGYAPDALTRIANYHITGDFIGMTGTGLLTRFWGTAQNYSFITGTSGRRVGSVRLSVDASLNNIAWKALRTNGKGCIMMMNYRTGEVVCLVSSPSVDPVYDTDIEALEDGSFVNRALSATYIPGSTFKLITAAAAIENIEDIEERQFLCQGEYDIAGVKIVCEESTAHGWQTFEEAMANSCNCSFARITVMLGQRTMVDYVKNYGFLSSHTINGIYTPAGNYPTEFVGDPELAWSGIGQSVDQVCPYTMLRYVAAIANGGTLAEPTFVADDTSGSAVSLIRPSTAQRLAELMRNNVETHYEGDLRFPGLPLCAKTGTAETGAGTSHSWFTGFLQDEEHPYAFVAVVEEGGYGLWTAGLMINEIFQTYLKEEP